MGISTIIQLVAQVGFPLAMEFIKMFEANPGATVTSDQMLALSAKWGKVSAADYLAAAYAAAGITPPATAPAPAHAASAVPTVTVTSPPTTGL